MSLLAYIKKQFPDLDRAQLRYVYRCCWMYICRQYTAVQFRNSLLDFDGKNSFKQFRLGLTEDFYFCGTLRYFGMFLLTRTGIPQGAGPLAAKVGVATVDLNCLLRLKRDNRLVGKMRRYRKERFKGTAPTPSFVRRRCDALIAQIRPAIAKVVARRLRFATIFNGQSLDDLTCEVVMRMVQQFYWSFEVRDDQWELRHLMTIAKNHIRNMASYFSTQKRSGASERDSIGVSKKVVLNESELGEETTLSTLPGGATDNTEQLQRQLDASKVMVMYGTTAKKTLLLTVLAGIESPSFNSWLLERGLVKPGVSHVDVQDRVNHRAFLRLVASWLGIKKRRAVRFVQRIKQELQENGYEHAC